MSSYAADMGCDSFVVEPLLKKGMINKKPDLCLLPCKSADCDKLAELTYLC
jgi:hypothetical protein